MPPGGVGILLDHGTEQACASSADAAGTGRRSRPRGVSRAHDQHHPHPHRRHQERAGAEAHPARRRRRSARSSRRCARSTTTPSRPRRSSSGSASRRARPSTTCCPRPSRSCARRGRRVLNMRHFDVQLIGGMALHRGMIAEMKTGEGKTLVATLAAYLNALSGKGVHVVTVNDYLAKRDSEWMGRLYRFLGLTVGVIQHQHGRPRAPGRLRRRHHLRDEQRVRLRLPARQHEVRPRHVRPARATTSRSWTRSTRS